MARTLTAKFELEFTNQMQVGPADTRSGVLRMLATVLDSLEGQVGELYVVEVWLDTDATWRANVVWKVDGQL